MKQILIVFLLSVTLAINAQPFRYIVAADGSGTHTTVQSAIDACPDNERSIIFVKNGIYFGQTSIGTKTVASSKLISLIGENRDKVNLTYDKSLPMVTKFEEATTFQAYAKDFYAENITFANSAGNTGQALALYTAGDRQTFKNCRILGYQDTYRSKKGTRGYFKNCWIEGATDFIYAGGTIFFDDCTINCVKGGGYIVAPEDAYSTIPKASTVCQKFLRIGFIFRNCNITANTDVAANTYYLGRPWNVTAGAFYLNCKLGKHIKAEGWQTMGGNETTACFAEYQSMDANGLPIDITGRVTWSFQLPQLDVENLLNPTYIYALSYTTSYDPETFCSSPSSPTNVKMIGNTISWDAVSGVAGYLVYKNSKFLTAVTETSFNDNSGENGSYYVVSLATSGVLSSPSTVTAIESIQHSKVAFKISKDKIYFSKPVTYAIYSLTGTKVHESKSYVNSISISNELKGIYLLKTEDEYSQEQIIKINLP